MDLLLVVVDFCVLVDLALVLFVALFFDDFWRLFAVVDTAEAEDCLRLFFVVSIHPSKLGVVDFRPAAGLLTGFGGNRIVICARGLVKNCSALSVHLRYTTVLENRTISWWVEVKI